MDESLIRLNIDFGSISHALGAMAYLLVSILLAKGYLRRGIDRALLLATLMSSFWLGILTLQALVETPPFHIRYSVEILRNVSWLAVLFLIIGVGVTPARSSGRTQYWLALTIGFLILLLMSATLTRGLFDEQLFSGRTLLVAQICLSLTGLVLLEQAWKNAPRYNRSSIRHLSLAIAALFAYDFFMYSDALLFSRVSPTLWDARGAVNAMAVPLIGLTLVNSKRQPLEVQVSRQFIFHTSALLVAGLYLLIISIGGYYIRFFGGDWSAGLQVLFFVGAILLFLVLAGSKTLRARMMVFISRHFFNYKYDYRQEWLRITRMLTATDANESLGQRVIRVLMSTVECSAGVLWARDEDDSFHVIAQVNVPEIGHHRIDRDASLLNYMRQSDWIIDLRELQTNPARYPNLEIPSCIRTATKAWLLVPLFLKDSLHGFVLICNPLARLELNWENYDLIKIVARQACSYLALSQAQDRLAEAKQFEAVNRTSAYLVHDLKTIIAQLSLMIRNADKHKANPVFIDDMLRTTAHTVDKMTHLLQQIRNPTGSEYNTRFDLVELLEEVIRAHGKSLPVPRFFPPKRQIPVYADRRRLGTVIGHILQNAQDATPKEGDILLTLKPNRGFVELSIRDSGCGMTKDFIDQRLFKPFDSTKGLAGMGIGAYQCREYLRKIGGGVEVTSEVGVGTCFLLKIPMAEQSYPDRDEALADAEAESAVVGGESGLQTGSWS